MTNIVDQAIELLNTNLSNEEKYRKMVELESQATENEADDLGETFASFIMQVLDDDERDLIESGEWDK